MKAMILAAGLGTRLRPLTNDRPKALVRLGERTLLEIAIERLRAFGIREIIVNVHHFADLVVDYLQQHGSFGLRIEVSREDKLLDTGGGLKQAAQFFLEDGREDPFLLHNVDVISTIDFSAMTQQHLERDALATLAMQHRDTSRPLLCDQSGQLRARGGVGMLVDHIHRKDQSDNTGLSSNAFCGIHVLSPRIFSLMQEEGAFSIIDVYLRLAAQGWPIVAFDADQYAWRDLGRPEHLVEAEAELRRGLYNLA